MGPGSEEAISCAKAQIIAFSSAQKGLFRILTTILLLE